MFDELVRQKIELAALARSRDERSSGASRESRFMSEFSVRWRRKITPSYSYGVALINREEKRGRRVPVRRCLISRIDRAPPSPGKYLSIADIFLFPRNLSPLSPIASYRSASCLPFSLRFFFFSAFCVYLHERIRPIRATYYYLNLFSIDR